MKKILTLFAMLFLTTGMIFAQTGVIISEYIEGSSNNKALEIYNGTGADIDFSNYRMLRANNGGTTSDTLNFVGTLIAGDVYVIANSNADQAILNVSDTTSSITFYNGDDYLGLEFWDGTNWVTIDVLGVLGFDPGSGWDVAGITTATSNHTLVRKSSITTGQTDWTISAGTNTTDSEWEVYDQDTFNYLGQHPGTGGGSGGGLPVIQSVSRDILVPDSGQAVTVSTFTYADNGLASVNLIYSTDGQNFYNVAMSLLSDSTYSASIPASVIKDTTFAGYFVIATDNNAQADTSDIYGFFAGVTFISWVKGFTNDNENFVSVAARVKGVCTAGSNNFSTGRIEAYLQDTTGAIKIFTFASNTPEMIEGNDYTVAGLLDSFHGQDELVPQILPDDIVDNGASTVPDPLVIKISDLLADAERYESMLITINDAVLSLSTPWPYPTSTSSSTLSINVGGTDSLALRIDSDTDIITATEPIWPAGITGLFVQFDAYQLLPRRFADFDFGDVVDDENTALPKTYSLAQNYPNPFNPTTTIKFSIPQNGFVTLDVFDVLGRKVRTLVNKEMQASYQTVEFDASSLASGVYVYRLKVNNFISAKKLLLMK